LSASLQTEEGVSRDGSSGVMRVRWGTIAGLEKDNSSLAYQKVKGREKSREREEKRQIDNEVGLPFNRQETWR
jgi:hypothetical protein